MKEQLVYELGNPGEYITPDVVADFTSIQLKHEGKNRVRVFGVKGEKPTPFYKVSISYSDGWISAGQLTYAWPQALEKAQKADQIIRQRIKDLKLKFDEIYTEFVGLNACHGPLSHPISEPNEVVLHIGVRGSDLSQVEKFGREITALVLCGPPAVTGFGSGRSHPKEVVAFWPALLPKKFVQPIVDVQ